jgi:hypothetical protein
MIFACGDENMSPESSEWSIFSPVRVESPLIMASGAEDYLSTLKHIGRLAESKRGGLSLRNLLQILIAFLLIRKMTSCWIG